MTARHVFNLQSLADERDWITGGGQMPTVTFNNVVVIACLLKETVWVKDFIKKFSTKLPSLEKKSTVTLAKARVLFSENKFKEAAVLLTPIEYNIDYAVLRVKSLLMCCHYEVDKNDIYFLKSTFRNFQIQIESMKFISEKVKNSFLNFIEILSKFTNKNTDYHKLLITIKQTESLVFRSWLTEKVKEEM